MNKYKISFLAIAIIICIFFSYTKVSALSCWRRPSVYINAYNQGMFSDGFSVSYRMTGDGCRSIPVVGGVTENQKNIAPLVAERSTIEDIKNGVYQFTSLCLDDAAFNRFDKCKDGTKVEKLSNNPSDFESIQSEWRQKANESYRDSLYLKGRTLLFFVPILLFLILWPSVTIKIWPHLKQRLPIITFISIFLKMALSGCLFLLLLLAQTGPNETLTYAVLSSCAVLALSIVVDIILLIRRKKATKADQS